VNIEAAQLSQDAAGGGATVMLRVDRDVPVDVQAAIRDAVEATLVETVDLS
jgi:D-3-phosphoglycerate dehydrogenase